MCIHSFENNTHVIFATCLPQLSPFSRPLAIGLPFDKFLGPRLSV